MEYGDFEYNCRFKPNADLTDVKVLSCNSPYPKNPIKRSIADLRFAMLEQKVLDISSLVPEKEYVAKIKCRFIDRGTSYDQLFSLLSLNEKSESNGS